MGEEHHHHAPPPVQAPPAGPPPPNLALSRGPVWNPTEQLSQLHYCIHSNPLWPVALLLGFQHYIVMLGTTVLIATTLVPAMGGDHGDKARVIQSLLFMSGVNTLLQTWFGSRLPTVMGGSFAFLLPVLSIINDYTDRTFPSEHEDIQDDLLYTFISWELNAKECLKDAWLRNQELKVFIGMRYLSYGWYNSNRFTYTIRTIQGSLIVSSFVNIFLGFSKTWGNLTRLFSPIIIVPLVCVVGLGLFARGFPLVANCVQIGLPMLILLVITQQYLKRLHHAAHQVLERFALLLCIAVIWAFAAILTVAGAYNTAKPQTQVSCRTDRSYLMSSAPWIKVPYPFQWGTPIFRASHVFGMMGAALVSSAESTGGFFAAARLSGATPPPAHVLSRSIGMQASPAS
ncbi:Nucleobase-ascorbate transporter 3 [Glycine soja]